MALTSASLMNDLRIAMIVMGFLACALHTIGFWALWNVKHENPYIAIERLYLLNLSVAENIHSAFLALSYFFFWYRYDEVGRHMFIFGLGGAFVWYMAILIMFTFDRFLALYLKESYTTLIDKRKVIIILRISFGLGLLAAILLIYFERKRDFEQTLVVIALYVWIPFDYIFILTSVTTYIYFAVRIRRSEVITKISINDFETDNGRTEKNEEFLTWKSNTVPLLLILTFVVFIGIPDNIHFWSFILKKELPALFESISFILYPTGIAADAIIYILCPKNMRQFLMRKLRELFRCHQTNDIKVGSNRISRDEYNQIP